MRYYRQNPDEDIRQLYRIWQTTGSDEDYLAWAEAAKRAGWNNYTRSGDPLGVWEEITEEDFIEALEVLPPLKTWPGGFILGEPYSSSINGNTVWLAYQQHKNHYYRALVTLVDLNDYIRELKS